MIEMGVRTGQQENSMLSVSHLLGTSEADLAETSLAVWMPQVYGAELTEFRGEQISVLVVERLPHTMYSWCNALLARPPDHAAVRLLADVILAFFQMVVAVVGELNFPYVISAGTKSG